MRVTAGYQVWYCSCSKGYIESWMRPYPKSSADFKSEDSTGESEDLWTPTLQVEAARVEGVIPQ